MAADLELRDIPSRVLVRRPLDVTELSLIRGIVVVNVERQFDCQYLSAVGPEYNNDSTHTSRTHASGASQPERRSGRMTASSSSTRLARC